MSKVLQVVSSFSNTTISTFSTSESDFLATTITPSATTSNILVLATAGLVDTNADTADIFFYLYRASTLLGEGSGGTHDVSSGWEGEFNGFSGYKGASPIVCNFLDTAISTTSATEYKLKFSLWTGTGYINRNQSSSIHAGSSLMLMEVDGA
jgi:hypothetical protein